MNKIFGFITEKNIMDLNYESNIFKQTKKISSYNYLLQTNNIEPFVKYDCQTKYIIIYNGILTNKNELRCKLRTLGYQFKTNLDEEVIINAYIYYKEKCFNLFKGGYSIIIYYNNKLVIARDKLGVKPLFYSKINNLFIASNEIKNILNSKLIKPIVDEIGIKELFALGPSYTPSITPFKDIKMVKPGEFIIYENNNITKEIYYKLPIYKYNKTYEEAKKELKELFNKSINNLIDQNNDYASLLSGGIDSSIVSYLASQIKDIDTYFLEYSNNIEYFKSNDFQKTLDRNYSDIMANYLLTNHRILTINEDCLFNYLIDAMKARDLPGMGDIDSSLFWMLEQIDNQFLLNGECSDELFSGYPWFYLENNTSFFPWIRNINDRQKLLNKNYQHLNLEEYLKISYKELIKDYQDSPYESTDNKHRLMTYINIYSFMQQLLYRQETISNANDIIALSPFIDNDIVEFAYNLPFNYKYRLKFEKAILKDTYKNVLPDEVINRIKNPYPKTYSPIYENLVANKIKEYLNDPTSKINRFFDKNKILELINSPNNVPYYGQLMTNTQFLSYLIQFEEWTKLYNIEFEI